MDRDAFHRAFTAWVLAIEELAKTKSREQSYQDLARHYGKYITTHQDLETVSECFNWGLIDKLIER